MHTDLTCGHFKLTCWYPQVKSHVILCYGSVEPLFVSSIASEICYHLNLKQYLNLVITVKIIANMCYCCLIVSKFWLKCIVFSLILDYKRFLTADVHRLVILLTCMTILSIRFVISNFTYFEERKCKPNFTKCSIWYTLS